MNVLHANFKNNLNIAFKTSVRFTTPKEVIDSYWEVEEKVSHLAEALINAKYPIFFTGAGISTSLGIPDYRSGSNTVVKTGPGLWNRDLSHSNQITTEVPIDKLVDLANPSLSHMAIATLLERGIVKHLVSQNTDGLHLRSGVSFEQISELHGNRNLQYCQNCGKQYLRDFRTLKRSGKKFKPGEKRDHFTHRNCENCGGDLRDSIIYFGQQLPKEQLVRAFSEAFKSDLVMCIGSSLTVRPSSQVPLFTLKKDPPGKICILNIQETPLDVYAWKNINYFCDEVMELLLAQLGIPINKLKITHYMRVLLHYKEDEWVLELAGKDRDGRNLSFMKEVAILSGGMRKQYHVEGHFVRIKIKSSDFQEQTWIQIVHFGEKKAFRLRLSALGVGQKQLQYWLSDSQDWSHSLA